MTEKIDGTCARLKDPATEIKEMAREIFPKEIAQLEEDGYLLLYRDIFIENGLYFLDVDAVKNHILYKLRTAKGVRACQHVNDVHSEITN